MTRTIGWIIVTLLFSGCGVPNSKTLSELDSDDREAVCDDLKKEDAICEGFGDVTRSRSGCEQLLASVNSRCDVTVEAYRESLEKSVCSMLEDWADWEHCFGEPEEEEEEDEVIVITTNNQSSTNNPSNPQNNGTVGANGVELVARDGIIDELDYYNHSFFAQIGTQQPIISITKVSFVLDPSDAFGTLSASNLCIPDGLVDSGLSGEFSVGLAIEEGDNTWLSFGSCSDRELGAVERRNYTDIEWIVEGELEDGTRFRASTDVSLTVE